VERGGRWTEQTSSRRPRSPQRWGGASGHLAPTSLRRPSLFAYTDHLHLPALDLALDPPRAAAFAFVSHGHTDHIARHSAGLATPATVALVAQRLGHTRLTPCDLGVSLERAGHRISLASAGHVLGAAQIVVDAPDGQRLVYTGDFSVRPRHSLTPAAPIHADVLIMECTYGQPQYVFPPDEEVYAQLRSFVERTLNDGVTPILLAYALGKAQETMALVRDWGYPVVVHPSIARLAAVYRQQGVDLGDYTVGTALVSPGQVLIAPPNALRERLPPRHRTLYLSGWALDHSAKYRFGVDEALPLSDHADYSELLDFVTRAAPGRVYTTHGPPTFADHLRRRGLRAEHLGEHQPALF
jgi:Cft2 family RNA processing exonuclease